MTKAKKHKRTEAQLKEKITGLRGKLSGPKELEGAKKRSTLKRLKRAQRARRSLLATAKRAAGKAAKPAEAAAS